MTNVFEDHVEECKAAMATQNEAVATAQRGYADAVELIRALEDKATLAARSEADAALGAARLAYDDAIEAAQRVYGETLQTSRDRAWKIMQARLSVWNGEAPPTFLPRDDPPAPEALGDVADNAMGEREIFRRFQP